MRSSLQVCLQILPDGQFRSAHWGKVELAGRDIIVVQAKRGRLGMYLMGQAVFSAELMRAFKPRSIRSIALCENFDAALGPLLDQYPNVEILLYPGDDSAYPPSPQPTESHPA